MTSPNDDKLVRVASFCGEGSCGCPQLWLDHDAPARRRVVLTDDFGQRVQLSLGQLADLVAGVKRGVLDELLATSR